MPILKLDTPSPLKGPVLNKQINEILTLTEHNTSLHLFGKHLGDGTLYLSSHRLFWLSSTLPYGYAIDYPSIVLHAISKDPSNYEHPCIYCQLESGLDESMNEQEDEDDTIIYELHFIPSNSDHLETIFKVFAEMSALNPDPNQSDESEDFSDDSLEEEMSTYYEDDGWTPSMSMNGEMDDITDGHN